MWAWGLPCNAGATDDEDRRPFAGKAFGKREPNAGSPLVILGPAFVWRGNMLNPAANQWHGALINAHRAAACKDATPSSRTRHGPAVRASTICVAHMVRGCVKVAR